MFSPRRLLAMGAGAGLMYLLDPKNGKQRRSSLLHRLRPYMDQAQDLAQTQAGEVKGQAADFVSHSAEQVKEQAGDLSNKVSSQVADLGGKVSSMVGRDSDAPSSTSLHDEAFPQDEQLRERVKSQLGTHPGISRDINVSAHEGRVYLTGTIEVDKLQEVISTARDVEGVREVVNQLHLVAH